jgi:hypothetical protein
LADREHHQRDRGVAQHALDRVLADRRGDVEGRSEWCTAKRQSAAE